MCNHDAVVFQSEGAIFFVCLHFGNLARSHNSGEKLVNDTEICQTGLDFCSGMLDCLIASYDSALFSNLKILSRSQYKYKSSELYRSNSGLYAKLQKWFYIILCIFLKI